MTVAGPGVVMLWSVEIMRLHLSGIAPDTTQPRLTCSLLAPPNLTWPSSFPQDNSLASRPHRPARDRSVSPPVCETVLRFARHTRRQLQISLWQAATIYPGLCRVVRVRHPSSRIQFSPPYTHPRCAIISYSYHVVNSPAVERLPYRLACHHFHLLYRLLCQRW